MASRGRMYNAMDNLDAIGMFFRAMRMRFGMTQLELVHQLFDISPIFKLAYFDTTHQKRRMLGYQLEAGTAGRMTGYRGPSNAFWATVYMDLTVHFNIEDEWTSDCATALISAMEINEGLITHAGRNPGDNEFIAFILETLG